MTCQPHTIAWPTGTVLWWCYGASCYSTHCSALSQEVASPIITRAGDRFCPIKSYKTPQERYWSGCSGCSGFYTWTSRLYCSQGGNQQGDEDWGKTTEGEGWLQISHHYVLSLGFCFCCDLTILLCQGNRFWVGKIAFLKEGVKIVSMILRADFLYVNICSRQNLMTKMTLTLSMMTYNLSILHSQRSQ